MNSNIDKKTENELLNKIKKRNSHFNNLYNYITTHNIFKHIFLKN